jgi:hypothetical protein
VREARRRTRRGGWGDSIRGAREYLCKTGEGGSDTLVWSWWLCKDMSSASSDVNTHVLSVDTRYELSIIFVIIIFIPDQQLLSFFIVIAIVAMCITD